MAKGTIIASPRGELQYCFIKGEGRNQAMPGEEPHFQFVASVVYDKNSKEHKALKKLIDTEWTRYCEENNVKGAPKTTGIKEIMEDGPEVDEYNAPIKVSTGKVRATFKTNVKWPNGNDQVVKVFQPSGADITAAYQAAPWSIGEGSEGIIHGTALGNNIGGTEKVTLYLTGVQLAKLSKYEGSVIETEELDEDDIDLGEDLVAAIPTEDEKPDL